VEEEEVLLALVVVGNLTWDRLIETPSFPEPNRDYLTLSDATHAGGAGGNVAAGLAQLGVPVAMAGAVGRDKRGTDLVADLDGYRVDTSPVQRVPAPTSEFLCVIDPDGNRSFLLNPGEAAFSLGIDTELDHATGFAFVGCRLSLAEVILDRLPAPRSSIFANIGFWIASGELGPEQIGILDRLECLFLNDDELDGMAAPVRDRLTSPQYLDENRRVVVTGGAAEAVVLTSKGSVALAPAPPPEIANTLGCGDAFMCGYLAAHLQGRDVEHCLTVAHQCAGRIAASPLERFLGQFDGIVVA
jgi:sugar/nucleoside kinase (ribokinase family)